MAQGEANEMQSQRTHDDGGARYQSLWFIADKCACDVLPDLPWGMNRGFPTTKHPQKPRPAERKGKPSKRKIFIKSIIREVAGQAPYERRLIELLRYAAL